MVPPIGFLSALYSISLTSCLLIIFFLGESNHKISQARVLRINPSTARLLEEYKLHSVFPKDTEIPSELAQVKFVTRLRNRRDLTERDFHIIQIHRSFSSEPIELHLVKKTLTPRNFKLVIKDGDKRTETRFGNDVESDCLYSATISSDPDGRAALSACGHESGFSGVIVSREGHWMIEPHPVPVDEFQRTMTVPHTLYRADEARKTIRLQSDVLHVPQQDLERAAKDDHAQRQHNAETTNSNERDEEADAYEIVGPFLTRPSDSEKSRNNNNLSYQPLTSTSFASSASKNASDRKRQASDSDKKTEKHTVEIAAFADADLYAQMKIRYPKDTMHKIKDYILTMINAMDMLYEQPSLGSALVFKLVHLEIQKSWPSKLNKNRGQAKLYLQSFCEYAGNLNANNQMWDHALMLTGMDIHEGGSAATAGLAWAGTMCYRFYSCSVSEATQFGSVYIITHEIGHSMGMEHDGEGVSKTCDKDKYIMSPTTGPGKVTWSNCSSKNLQDFIKHGSSELSSSKTANPPSCLTETSRENQISIDYSNGTLPGQKYDATKQCILAMGKKFSPTMKKQSPFNNICSMLYCGNKTHAVSTHPALEGTECSSGKICRGGKCVERKG